MKNWVNEILKCFSLSLLVLQLSSFFRELWPRSLEKLRRKKWENFSWSIKVEATNLLLDYMYFDAIFLTMFFNIVTIAYIRNNMAGANRCLVWTKKEILYLPSQQANLLLMYYYTQKKIEHNQPEHGDQEITRKKPPIPIIFSLWPSTQPTI